MPLAYDLRPESLNDVIGQGHLVGDGGLIRLMAEKDVIQSMILWGPAGTGKTTIAYCLSQDTACDFEILNATSAKVTEVRKIIEIAEKRLKMGTKTIVFIDEVHRFSKSQQDVLLPAVEAGTIILIGATTEKPAHSVNNALLSRMQTYELKPLSPKDMMKAVIKVVGHYKENGKSIKIGKKVAVSLINKCTGDARKLIAVMETVAEVLEDGDFELTEELLNVAMPEKHVYIDARGVEHFDMAQMVQTAMQNSDTNSAIYWLAKWIKIGEDPRYICRRLLVSAAEDAANNPNAQTAALSACYAAENIGLPECRINMAQAVIEISESSRCRSAIDAIDSAIKDIKNGFEPNVLHADNSKHNSTEGYVKINKKKYAKGWKDT